MTTHADPSARLGDNWKSITSLILGVFSVVMAIAFGLGVVVGVLAVAFGGRSLYESNTMGARPNIKAISGVLLGIVGLVLFVAT